MAFSWPMRFRLEWNSVNAKPLSFPLAASRIEEILEDFLEEVMFAN